MKGATYENAGFDFCETIELYTAVVPPPLLRFPKEHRLFR